MTDIKSVEERSRNMAAIKSKNTKPEVYIRKELFSRGFRYRIAPLSVPGHPDIYLGKYRLAVYVNGCFWHRHEGCKYAYLPKSKVDFWKKKFDTNILRDQNVREELQKQGFRHLIIWECAIRQAQKKTYSKESLIDTVINFIISDETYGEISIDCVLSL